MYVLNIYLEDRWKLGQRLPSMMKSLKEAIYQWLCHRREVGNLTYFFKTVILIWFFFFFPKQREWQVGHNAPFHRILEIFAWEELWTHYCSMSHFILLCIQICIWEINLITSFFFVFSIQFNHNEQQVFKTLCHKEMLSLEMLFGFSITFFEDQYQEQRGWWHQNTSQLSDNVLFSH